MSETRSSNFECLRILAIILILIMHSYAQGGRNLNSVPKQLSLYYG